VGTVTHVTLEGKFHRKPGTDTIGRPMLEIPMLDDDETLLAGDATPRRPFEERPPGTRQERLREGRGILARRATYRDRWFRR
jgi:hypothetical protein